MKKSTALHINAATYNILHGADFPRKCATGEDKVDLSLAIRAIEQMNPHVCALNEVRNQENVEGLCNQARYIAEALGYHYIFARAIDHAGGEYGNALLSKFPITSAKLIPLSVPQTERLNEKHYEDRVILQANINVNGQDVTVLVTHFGLNEDEIRLAVDTLLEIAKTETAPLLLMGDFNITPDDAQYSRLAAKFNDTAKQVALNGDLLLTFPSNAPRIKIDYIFTGNAVNTLSVSVPDIITSDHKPLSAELEILARL